MQDRISQIDEILLHRTAGPYIWVNMRNTRGEYFTFRYALNNGHWAEIS